MKRVVIVGLWMIVATLNAQTQSTTARTEVKDNAAKARLLGTHRLSLQWISWDYFGKAVVTEKNGILSLKGEQRARKGDDYLTIEGVITQMDKLEFRFVGTITTKVSHINGGQPCRREGEMSFAIKGNRRYWRLQQMDNPCDPVTDYVDIFFR